MHAQGNYTNCKKYGFSSGDENKKKGELGSDYFPEFKLEDKNPE